MAEERLKYTEQALTRPTQISRPEHQGSAAITGKQGNRNITVGGKSRWIPGLADQTNTTARGASGERNRKLEATPAAIREAQPRTTERTATYRVAEGSSSEHPAAAEVVGREARGPKQRHCRAHPIDRQAQTDKGRLGLSAAATIGKPVSKRCQSKRTPVPAL